MGAVDAPGNRVADRPGSDPLPRLRVPAGVEDVTAEWLTEVLSFRYPGVRVERTEVLEVIEGTATKVRVRNVYDEVGRSHGLPAQMIVKGAMAAHSEAMREVYLREALFYHHVAPHELLRMPRCYVAAQDRAGSFRCVVVLEDLDVRGARFCHATRPPAYEDALARVRALARLHATYWDHPGFATGGALDWVQPNLGHPWFDAYLEGHLQRWDEILARPVGAFLPRRLRDPERFRRALRALQVEHTAGPPTLCHGDTHPGNLYVDADGTPGFFDPYPVRAPWPYEIAYHLVMSLDVGDRREWERPLLGAYVAALADFGVREVPAFDDAWLRYRRNVALGLLIALVNDSAFQVDSVNALYVTRFADAALTLATFDALDGVTTS